MPAFPILTVNNLIAALPRELQIMVFKLALNPQASMSIDNYKATRQLRSSMPTHATRFLPDPLKGNLDAAASMYEAVKKHGTFYVHIDLIQKRKPIPPLPIRHVDLNFGASDQLVPLHRNKLPAMKILIPELKSLRLIIYQPRRCQMLKKLNPQEYREHMDKVHKYMMDCIRELHKLTKVEKWIYFGLVNKEHEPIQRMRTITKEPISISELAKAAMILPETWFEVNEMVQDAVEDLGSTQ